MRVILVRHYRTINNEARRIMGWGDAPRAKDWEEDLLDVYGVLRSHDIHFDGFYSSALDRARNTAHYFSKKYGYDAVVSAFALNEVNYGELYQRPKQWVEEHYPAYKVDPDFVFPGGESFRQMQRRSVDFLLSMQRLHAEDTLLVVAHAGVIRALVSHFMGLDFAANLKQKVSHRYVGEFVIEADTCVLYDELGKPSGFVKEGSVRVPYRAGEHGVGREGDVLCREPAPEKCTELAGVRPAATG